MILNNVNYERTINFFEWTPDSTFSMLNYSFASCTLTFCSLISDVFDFGGTVCLLCLQITIPYRKVSPMMRFLINKHRQVAFHSLRDFINSLWLHNPLWTQRLPSQLCASSRSFLFFFSILSHYSFRIINCVWSIRFRNSFKENWSWAKTFQNS